MIEEEFEDTLLIRRRDAPAVLVVDEQDGVGLPRVHTAGHHPADVAPTRAAVRGRLGLEAIVLACRRVAVHGDVVHRLLELELLDGQTIKTGFKWANTRGASDPAQHATRDDWFPAAEQPREPEDGRGWTVPKAGGRVPQAG